jgi:hypothetical protein
VACIAKKQQMLKSVFLDFVYAQGGAKVLSMGTSIITTWGWAANSE